MDFADSGLGMQRLHACRPVLAMRDLPCEHARPMNTSPYLGAQPLATTSARMASGMTSRARRPEPHTPAG